jgi:hypothetical protein
MPAYASSISDENARWALVAYVLALSPAARPSLKLADFAKSRLTRIGGNGRVLAQ